MHELSWPQYLAISDALPDRPRLRLTYDRGSLELRTTSPHHELYKKRLGRLVETLAEVFGKEIVPAGNMTFRREDLERGLEPDECFWVAQESHMRSKLTWDPALDPPPDLVVEVEISRSALNRLAIYAALGVPEVWRCDGETLFAELLQPDRTWRRSESSRSFPGFAMNDLMSFLHLSESVSYFESIRSVRSWLEQQLSKR